VGPPISGRVFNRAALLALGGLALVGLIILLVILLIAFLR